MHRIILLLVSALLGGAVSRAAIHAKDFFGPVHFSATPVSPGFVAETERGRIRIAADGWSSLDDKGRSTGGLRFQASSRSTAFDPSEPAGPVSWFAGNDPRNWIRGAASYGRIKQSNIYPGVDVVYYGSQGKLEFDFVIAAQADLHRLSLVWTGSSLPKLNPDGSLALSLEPGGIRLAAPVAYQMSGKALTVVECHYAVKGRSVSFRVGRYDRKRQLVIDPKLVSSGLVRNQAQSACADPNGNLYLAGTGAGPATAGAYKSGYPSAFVTKRDKNGTTLWTANLGPLNPSTPVSIAVDASGDVFLAGSAYSGYPVTAGAFPVGVEGGLLYGAVSKISADGSTLLKSTLLTSSLFGGDGADAVTALAVSPTGQVTVAGTLFALRTSLGTPFAVHQPGGFAARLTEDWTNVVYSRSLRMTPSLLAVDNRGNAVVGGAGVVADESPVSLQPASLDASFYIGVNSGVTIQKQQGQPITNAIAADPNHPLSMLKGTTSGVFQSSDGGLTWQLVELGSPGVTFTGVWIHPKNLLLRFASGQQILFRSEDGGESWQSVRTGSTFSAFFDVGDRVMANTLGSGIPYYSSDEGKTWNPLFRTGFGFNCCVVDRSNPRHFLMGSDVNALTLETLDGGISFRTSLSNVRPLAFDPIFRECSMAMRKAPTVL